MAISTKPTQEFIPIKEIRDDVFILKDGSLHMILMASHFEFRPQVGRGAECHNNAIPKFFKLFGFLGPILHPIKKAQY